MIMCQKGPGATHDLVQEAQRVSDAAAGFPGDKLQALVFDLVSFFSAEISEVVDNRVQGYIGQIVSLAS